MALLGELPVTIKRDAGDGGRTDGEWVEGTRDDVELMISIQPGISKAFQRSGIVDELRAAGKSTHGAITAYCESELKAITPTTKPDHIPYKGKWYEVYALRDWIDDPDLGYYGAVCLLQPKLVYA